MRLETSEQNTTKPRIQTGLNQDLLSVVIVVLDTISEDVAGMNHWGMFHWLTDKGILMTQQKLQCSWSVSQASYRNVAGSLLTEKVFENLKADRSPPLICAELEYKNFFLKLGFCEVERHNMDLSIFAPPFGGFGPFRLIKTIWPAWEEAVCDAGDVLTSSSESLIYHSHRVGRVRLSQHVRSTPISIALSYQGIQFSALDLGYGFHFSSN